MPDGNTDIVHPEVRAHINSLVSAVGLDLIHIRATLAID